MATYKSIYIAHGGGNLSAAAVEGLTRLLDTSRKGALDVDEIAAVMASPVLRDWARGHARAAARGADWKPTRIADWLASFRPAIRARIIAAADN